jgi:hypothetical protein
MPVFGIEKLLKFNDSEVRFLKLTEENWMYETFHLKVFFTEV